MVFAKSAALMISADPLVVEARKLIGLDQSLDADYLRSSTAD
jgi:hypothetical protein